MNITPLVAIGVPSWGKVSIRWAQMRAHLMLGLGCTSMDIIDSTYDKDIAAKRNEIAERALKAGAKYLLFLGDDVHAPSNAAIQLMSRGKDLVTGIYWTKTYPTEPYIWRDFMKGTYKNWHMGEFFKVDMAGCDLLLIKTSILNQIPQPWWSRDWVFSNKQLKPSALSTEDFYFFLKARKSGINLWADTTVQALHEDRDTGAFFGLTQDMPQSNSKIKIPKKNDKLIADLGCGLYTPHFDGKIVRFDIREEVKPDVRCDVRQIPEEDCKYDIVHASHVLEHFSSKEAPGLIKEWLRILKVGGELILAVPDLELAMNNILQRKSDDYDWWVLYGQQEYSENFHKTGYTAWTLEKLLGMIPNLRNIKIEKNDRELKVHAIKSHHLKPEDLGKLFEETREKSKVKQKQKVNKAKVENKK